MTKRWTTPAVIVSVLAALGLHPAGATTMVDGSGLTNPLSVIDFSGLDGHSLITAPIDGVTFTGLYSTDQFSSDSFPPSAPPAGVNFAPPNGTPIATVTMTFATPQSNVTFFLVTSGGAQETVTSFLGGTEVEQITGISNSLRGGFYGFTNSNFDSITISSTDQNPAVLIDNIQLGATVSDVPEPMSASLFLVGVAGIGLARSYRRVWR